jgi:hypothetical protein
VGLLPEREFRKYQSLFKWDNATDGKNGSTTGSWMVCFYHLFMSGVSYFFVGLVVLIEKEDREKDHSISVRRIYFRKGGIPGAGKQAGRQAKQFSLYQGIYDVYDLFFWILIASGLSPWSLLCGTPEGSYTTPCAREYTVHGCRFLL